MAGDDVMIPGVPHAGALPRRMKSARADGLSDDHDDHDDHEAVGPLF
jgi:hypothetical protein